MARHTKTETSAKTVENASGMGLTHLEIGRLIGVSDVTLRKRYRNELNDGMAKANYNVSKSLYENCVTAKNVTAQIWWEKTRMGKRETVQVTTPAGQPFESTDVPPEPELIGKYHERLAQIAADSAARGAAARVGASPLPEDQDDSGDREG